MRTTWYLAWAYKMMYSYFVLFFIDSGVLFFFFPILEGRHNNNWKGRARAHDALNFTLRDPSHSIEDVVPNYQIQ
jgi:hypothetical protein